MDLFVGKKATRTLTLNAEHVQTFAELPADAGRVPSQLQEISPFTLRLQP